MAGITWSERQAETLSIWPLDDAESLGEQLTSDGSVALPMNSLASSSTTLAENWSLEIIRAAIFMRPTTRLSTDTVMISDKLKPNSPFRYISEGVKVIESVRVVSDEQGPNDTKSVSVAQRHLHQKHFQPSNRGAADGASGPQGEFYLFEHAGDTT